MNTPQAFEPTYPQPVPTNVGDDDTFIVTDKHRGYVASPCNQQGDLSLYFKGDGGQLAAQFTGDDFMAGYSSAVDILESF
jgi:hypothetical protein